MFSRISMKKVVFWLFVTMAGSFLIAGSILFTSGIDKTFRINSVRMDNKNVVMNNSGTTTSSSTAGQEDINVEKTFPASGVKEIDLSTVSTGINVIPVDGSEIKVHFHGTFTANNGTEPPELVAGMKGSKLEVQVKHKPQVTVGFNVVNSNLRLDIYVPRTYAEDLSAGSVSGSLTVDGFKLGSLSCKTTSGSLNLSSVTAKNTEFSTTSGKMNANGFVGNLDFRSVSGSLEVKYASFANNVKVHTASGKSRIELPADAQFNLSFRSTSGKLRSGFPVTVNDSPGSHRTEASVGSSNNKISIESVSGDAEISK